MTRPLCIILSVAALLVLGERVGLVGFHYPRVVDNEPLQDPVGIAGFEGKRLTLEDGRAIEVEEGLGGGELADFFATGKRVDVEDDGSVEVRIYANKRGWVCGTPWARAIRIPVFPDDVPRNRRQLVALGTVIPAESIR